jgi:hypothetical protein
MLQETLNGSFLCEFGKWQKPNGKLDVHRNISIRAWLECVAIRKLPYFFKRKSKNQSKIYEQTGRSNGVATMPYS